MLETVPIMLTEPTYTSTDFYTNTYTLPTQTPHTHYNPHNPTTNPSHTTAQLLLQTLTFLLPRFLVPSPTTKPFPTEFWHILLISSILLAFYLAHAQSKRLSRSTRKAKKRLVTAWRTTRWPAFTALCELHIQGRLPWGPWDKSTITPQRWPERIFLLKLLRVGVIPLRISSGGTMKYILRDGRYDHRATTKLPVFARSEGRAYFDFLVPFPEGDGVGPVKAVDERRRRRRFVGFLAAQREFAVSMTKFGCGDLRGYKDGLKGLEGLEGREKEALREWREGGEAEDEGVDWYFTGDWGEYIGVYDFLSEPVPRREPLEVGTTSTAPFLHSFKEEAVLQRARGTHRISLDDFVRDTKKTMPLVRWGPHAVVHIEARDYNAHRLDRFVYNLGRSAGLLDIRSGEQPDKSIDLYIEQLGIADLVEDAK